MRILTWNLERKKPTTPTWTAAVEKLFGQDPDIMVLTEARTTFPLRGGHIVFSDMAKWDAALYTERLLTKARLDQMWTRVRLNDGSSVDYSFGWRVALVNGHRLIEHGGSWQGFKAQISRYVDDKLTVIVLANLAEADQGRIAHEVAGLLEPALKPPSTPR